MPSIFEVRDVNALIWFAVWVLAITAATKAVFRSFLAAELTWWLPTRGEGRERRVNQLNWEVHHRVKYDPTLASRGNGSADAAPTVSDDEIREKRTELLKLARGSFGQRNLNWLLNCTACQAFWLALGAYSTVRGFDGALSPFASALAYSCGVVVLTNVIGSTSHPAGNEPTRIPQPGKGCAGCGK